MLVSEERIGKKIGKNLKKVRKLLDSTGKPIFKNELLNSEDIEDHTKYAVHNVLTMLNELLENKFVQSMYEDIDDISEFEKVQKYYDAMIEHFEVNDVFSETMGSILSIMEGNDSMNITADHESIWFMLYSINHNLDNNEMTGGHSLYQYVAHLYQKIYQMMGKEINGEISKLFDNLSNHLAKYLKYGKNVRNNASLLFCKRTSFLNFMMENLPEKEARFQKFISEYNRISYENRDILLKDAIDGFNIDPVTGSMVSEEMFLEISSKHIGDDYTELYEYLTMDDEQPNSMETVTIEDADVERGKIDKKSDDLVTDETDDGAQDTDVERGEIDEESDDKDEQQEFNKVRMVRDETSEDEKENDSPIYLYEDVSLALGIMDEDGNINEEREAEIRGYWTELKNENPNMSEDEILKRIKSRFSTKTDIENEK